MAHSRFPILQCAKTGALCIALLLLKCSWNSLYLDHASVRTIQPQLPVYINTDLASKLTLRGGVGYLPQSSFDLDGPNPAISDKNVSLQLPKWSWSVGIDQYLLRFLVIGFSANQDAGNGRFRSSQLHLGFRIRADNAYLQLNVFYARQRLTNQSWWSLQRTEINPLPWLIPKSDTSTSYMHSTGDLQASQFGIQATFNSAREFFRCIPGLCAYTDIGALTCKDTLDQSLPVDMVQFGIRPQVSIRLVDHLYLSTYFDNNWYFAVKDPIWNKLYHHWKTGTELLVDLKGF